MHVGVSQPKRRLKTLRDAAGSCRAAGCCSAWLPSRLPVRLPACLRSFCTATASGRISQCDRGIRVKGNSRCRSVAARGGRGGGSAAGEVPENGEVLDVTASLYQGLGKTKDAVRCWETSIELSPALGPIAHAAMGAAAYDGGNLEAAVTHYRAAMQADSASAVYPVHLGQALIDQGRLPEAVASLETSLRAADVDAHLALLGQAYLKLRQYDKARQHFEYTVALEPGYTNAFFGLATACARLGTRKNRKST